MSIGLEKWRLHFRKLCNTFLKIENINYVT